MTGVRHSARLWPSCSDPYTRVLKFSVLHSGSLLDLHCVPDKGKLQRYLNKSLATRIPNWRIPQAGHLTSLDMITSELSGEQSDDLPPPPVKTGELPQRSSSAREEASSPPSVAPALPPPSDLPGIEVR